MLVQDLSAYAGIRRHGQAQWVIIEDRPAEESMIRALQSQCEWYNSPAP